ncbi:hypothetical protein NDU88_006261 [Pleurodeles waltl]|uniref:Secreted protein n=1 Tax=Pleurodeles waltl TaxID=8319 RepID=A0AAV7WZM6_PLEWA|nr:hypothetical protein NDU88_006261 [Pleurodeles waltl]
MMPALLLPVPVLALEWSCESEAVRDRATVRGEGTEFDRLYCAWKCGARHWAYSFVASNSSSVHRRQGQSE